MNTSKYRVFVCTKQRNADDSEGCCRDCGAMAIYEAFQLEVQRQQLTELVEIRQSGCLDGCASGPVALVIPPQNKAFTWLPTKLRIKLRTLLFPNRHTYVHLTLNRVSAIVQSHFLHGRPLRQGEI
jgi:(2Fe-2S) ferredoxin